MEEKMGREGGKEREKSHISEDASILQIGRVKHCREGWAAAVISKKTAK